MVCGRNKNGSTLWMTGFQTFLSRWWWLWSLPLKLLSWTPFFLSNSSLDSSAGTSTLQTEFITCTPSYCKLMFFPLSIKLVGHPYKVYVLSFPLHRCPPLKPPPPIIDAHHYPQLLHWSPSLDPTHKFNLYIAISGMFFKCKITIILKPEFSHWCPVVWTLAMMNYRNSLWTVFGRFALRYSLFTYLKVLHPSKKFPIPVFVLRPLNAAHIKLVIHSTYVSPPE